jgi:Flp pilus assembly protein TadG
MALVLPVVVIVLMALLEFSRLVYAYGTVSEAARAAARYAIVHGARATTPVGPAANNATLATVAMNNAPALDIGQLTVTSSWGYGSNDANCPVTVTVTYNYLPLFGQLLSAPITLTGSTTMLITH